RDTVRGFWCGQQGHLAALSERLCGSSDLYRACGRLPTDSINFVTVHDGFTLHDLGSYNVKHNEANGGDNRDGDNHNRSWNCGAEGPTDDEVVNALRERQKRNLLATLFLSQGTPLLLAG
ncbi:glycogen debranching enzyme GlgX, partial [Escherichia coli]|nr:glycogen debranching enzyme GlgX [Escherichia coli]